MELSPLVVEILGFVVPALLSALGVAATAAVGYGAKLLQARVKTAKAWEAVHVFENIVRDAISEAEQTTVRAFKNGIEDAKLDAEDAKTVRDGVVKVIKRQLGARLLAELSKYLGTVDDGRIRTAVEAQLHLRK